MEQKTNNNKEDGFMGSVPIHSQVRKIRQEMEKINHPALQQPEIRPVVHEIARQKRCRSPLGEAFRNIHQLIAIPTVNSLDAGSPSSLSDSVVSFLPLEDVLSLLKNATDVAI
ncbi:uncharacterized protein Fot_33375 [Forsythia ovata]|uniref:Uncharacterized protein n=1 Tax=Forsythia ovata TaxID=205694 RepID=A0ABD1TAG4_9LAMI